jgi:hypothetical protein
MAAGSPSIAKLGADGSTPVTGAFAIVTAAPGVIAVNWDGYSGNYVYGNVNSVGVWNGIVASDAEMQRLTT